MRKAARLKFILFVLICLSLSVALSLYALRENISYFKSPSEVRQLQAAGSETVAPGRVFRLGGLVEEGSLEERKDTLEVAFVVTDSVTSQKVTYKGIVPDLFREGQGVVATGSLDAIGVFEARELLAKHDENYMPPEVAKSLRRAHEAGAGKMQAQDDR